MTPFRDIIHEWFEQRIIIEQSPMSGAAFDTLPLGEQLITRHQSLVGHLKIIIWQLKQQKKNTKTLSDILEVWVDIDQTMEQANISREHREELLYKTLEDYLNGQGYPTALPLPDLS
jgi:hypothetical protein